MHIFHVELDKNHHVEAQHYPACVKQDEKEDPSPSVAFVNVEIFPL
jgi:hypothetical protein